MCFIVERNDDEIHCVIIFLPTVRPAGCGSTFPCFAWPGADSHSIPLGDGVRRLLESEKLCCFLDSCSGSRSVPPRSHQLMNGSPSLDWMVTALLPFPLKINKNVQISNTPLHLLWSCSKTALLCVRIVAPTPQTISNCSW